MKKTLSIYLSILFLGLVGLRINYKGVIISLPNFTVDPPEMRLLGDSRSTTYMNFQRCRLLNDNFNLIGDTFNDDGTVMTRTVGGEAYPVTTQDAAQFILRIRQ